MTNSQLSQVQKGRRRISVR